MAPNDGQTIDIYTGISASAQRLLSVVNKVNQIVCLTQHLTSNKDYELFDIAYVCTASVNQYERSHKREIGLNIQSNINPILFFVINDFKLLITELLEYLNTISPENSEINIKIEKNAYNTFTIIAESFVKSTLVFVYHKAAVFNTLSLANESNIDGRLNAYMIELVCNIYNLSLEIKMEENHLILKIDFPEAINKDYKGE